MVSGGKGLVHALNIIGGENVVGIKDEIAVKAPGEVPGNMYQQILQGISLAYTHGIVPLIHGGAGRPGNRRRMVGAVVRHHKDLQQLRRVILIADAVQQMG